MRIVLRASMLALLTAVVFLFGGLAIGYVVKYWTHVADWLLIIGGVVAIVCLTLWSDH